MQGKFIFIDGDINVYAKGMSNLSNVMVVAAGAMEVNGSDTIDVVTSHSGQIDTVFASGGNCYIKRQQKF